METLLQITEYLSTLLEGKLLSALGGENLDFFFCLQYFGLLRLSIFSFFNRASFSALMRSSH